MAHIQNTAPGPPKKIADATPVMLPVPTRPPSAMAKPWKEDTPLDDALPSNNWATMSLIRRSCGKRMRTEKKIPAPRQP